VAVREAVHEVLPGTVMGSRPAAGAGKLLTVEQLAALEKASAAADAAGKHTHKVRAAAVGADRCRLSRGQCGCWCVGCRPVVLNAQQESAPPV